MYLWVALKLNESFAKDIRKKCLKLNESINLSMQALSLPAHISLKISFDINKNDINELIDKIISLVKSYLPIKVTSNVIEKNNSIIWVDFKENESLINIHNKLDEMLLSHGIDQHEFDKNFKFHSTLFMDENIDLIDKMYELIKDIDVKDSMILDTIMLGKSLDGINYSIFKEEKL